MSDKLAPVETLATVAVEFTRVAVKLGVPPTILALKAPVIAPLQTTFVTKLEFNAIAGISVMTKFFVVVQPKILS
jgi:hypothetical protein